MEGGCVRSTSRRPELLHTASTAAAVAWPDGLVVL